ncbi:uncharacterized protein LTHEOB_10545 [Lasiodiplodia theobromae]|uniref:uncharacterized protein n=1 Tax=Lasiodiplodia theobromae TaxID=45133 RepID=UPI0015C38B9A|nr:uncharacterized protein LTHEOB_10545 [Lasiodiplodia theobromae]KAF4539153.1 hypothetical protein LTHEOB_10545 [Lasiodiplodia theobromae]
MPARDESVGGDLPMNDDIITINTQSSTQWDGFRHHAWAQNGGLQTRGVLVDWAGWARKQDIPINFLEGSIIPLDHVKAIISEKKIELRPGDVLFIRSGFAEFLKALSVEDQLNISQRSPPEYIGLESTKATLRWFWENQLSAVAGDTVGLETMGGSNTEYLLHQWLLAGWGMPIGELFDLEELAERCAQEGRYTFYLSSVPVKMPGGVASPPNAVAIL